MVLGVREGRGGLTVVDCGNAGEAGWCGQSSELIPWRAFADLRLTLEELGAGAFVRGHVDRGSEGEEELCREGEEDVEEVHCGCWKWCPLYGCVGCECGVKGVCRLV